MQTALQEIPARTTNGAFVPSHRAPGAAISAIASQSKLGVVVTIARGKTVFGDGDDARYSYKVVEGAIRLSKIMLDGRRQISEFALAGDMFGFECGDQYELLAETITPVTLVRYSRAHIERLGEEFADVRRELMTMLRRGWTSAQNHLVMLGRQTAKERIAAFLVGLRAHQAGANTIDLPMSRQDIADYLGLTIETVCRTLTELKSARILSIPSRHKVVILDLDALRSLAEGDETND